MTTSAVADTALPQLRAVAYRITALQSTDLARIVPHLAFQLAPCRHILLQPQPSSSEAAATIHQIKTRVSSLLQDRTEESRFAGVALVKILIDLGGWEILHTSASWLRSLISILGRPSDATVTKRMCILAVVRIFQKTHDHDNLVREITTPNLPSFVSACLTVLQVKEGQIWSAKQEELLELVLSSWSALMPKHPTIFRPFISQIRKILDQILPSADGSLTQNKHYTPTIKDAARRTYVLLHGSATKAGDLEDRDSGVNARLKLSNAVAQRLMTLLYGDEHSRTSSVYNQFQVNGNLQAMPNESLVVNLIEQLGLITEYYTTLTTKPSNLPIGSTIALLQHLTSFSLTRSTSGSSMTKNARQGLLLDLPALHQTCLEVAYVILKRLDKSATSIARDILDCAIDALDNNPHNDTLRSMIYIVTEAVVKLIGHDFNEKTSRVLHSVIKQCCKDLSPTQTEVPAQTTTANGKAIAATINPHAIIGNTQTRDQARTPDIALQNSAQQLLMTLLTELPANALPAAIRTDIERTAILTRQSNVMIASVLNPRNGSASLLPFAAQLSDDALSLESLLRPRVPVVLGNPTTIDAEDGTDDESMADVDNENGITSRWRGGDNIVIDNPQDLIVSNADSNYTAVTSDKKHALDDNDNQVPKDTSSSPVKRQRFDLENFLPPKAQPSHFEASTTPAVMATSSIQPQVDAQQLFAAETGATVSSEIKSLGSIAPAVGFTAQVAQTLSVDVSATADADDDGDDDDDDDFEIPPLVMNDDFDDDESDQE